MNTRSWPPFARAAATVTLTALSLSACGSSAQPPDAQPADARSELAAEVSTDTPSPDAPSVPDATADLPTADASSDISTDTPSDLSTDISTDIARDAPDASREPAVIVVDRTSFDFGSWDCGSAPPAEQTLTITNDGPSEGAYRITLADGWFTVAGPTTGTLSPGAHAAVRIAPHLPLALATPPRAGADVSDRLDVVPIGSALGGRTVDLHVVRHGAELVGGGAEDFVSDTTSAPIVRPSSLIRNQGDRPITLRLNRALDAAFTFTLDGEVSDAVTLMPGQTLNPTIRYAPTTSGAQSGTVRFTPTGALCVDTSEPWTLSGRSSTGELLVSGDIDFGDVSCGETGTARVVTLTNPGAAATSYTAALLAGAESRYRISPSSGTIPARGTETVTVTPLALDATVALPRSDREELQIRSPALPTEGRTLALTRAAQGAVLRWRSTDLNRPLRTVLGFDASTEYELENTGSAPALVTFTTTAPERIHLDTPGPVSIAPGGSVVVAASWRPTTDDATAFTATLRANTTSPLCQPLPEVNPTMTAALTTGGLVVGASEINFVDVSVCAETPPDQYLPLTNTSNVPITATIGATSPFAVYDNATRIERSYTIPARTTRVLSVRAPALTNPLARRFGELDVEPDGETLSARTALRITQTTRYAQIATDRAVNLGDALAVGFERRNNFRLFNYGTAPARMTARNTTTGQSFEVLVPAGTTALAGLASVEFSRVVRAGPFTENIEVSYLGSGADPTCGAGVQTAQITGIGATGALILTASSIDFGDNYCRQSRPNGQALTITNNTGLARTWTAAIDSSDPQFDIVSSGSLSLAPGGRTALALRPRAAMMQLPGQIRQALVFSSPGIPDQRVELVQTIRGATLRAVGSSLVIPPQPVRGTPGSASPAAAGWTNAYVMDGNAPISPYLFFPGDLSHEWFVNTAIDRTPTAFHATVSVGADPAVAGVRTTTLMVSVPAPDPLCGPLPAPIAFRTEGSAGARLIPTPSRIYFGLVACGATPDNRFLTLRNTATATAPFTVRLPAGSRFTVNPMSGTIPGGGAATLTVSSAAIPQNYQPATTTPGAFFQDNLSGAFTVVSGTNELPIEVDETAYGNAYVFESRRSTLFNAYSASLTRTEPLPGVTSGYDLQTDYTGSCSRVSESTNGLTESHIATCDSSRAGSIAFRVVGSTLVGSCSPIGVRQMYSAP